MARGARTEHLLMDWERVNDMNATNILFIDDDDAFRLVISEVLDHLGYRVQSVSSLSEALTALKQTAFDLVLSDLCISGDKDGLLVLDFLDSLELRVPVIFITGSGYGEWLVAEAKETRPVGFLQKPVTMSELAVSIESVCPQLQAQWAM